MRWELFEERFIESFHVESWLEHLRQHDRITVADREVEEMIAPHVREKQVSHWVPPRGP